jgi:hypothetical protein
MPHVRERDSKTPPAVQAGWLAHTFFLSLLLLYVRLLFFVSTPGRRVVDG